jgi:alpha-L-rhamnosidase
MKRQILMLALWLVVNVGFGQVTVKNLLTENLSNPIGLDIAQPRFTWQLQSDKRNVLQTAYEIRLAASLEDVARGKNLLWSSGKVVSEQSVLVDYAGGALQSGTRYFWQVRVWDNQSTTPSVWSAAAQFQMAFLTASDWKAQWITPNFPEDSTRPSPLLRKTFSLSKKVKSATAYITAHGLYEAHLNGKRIGDAYLTPGWTTYKKRLQYQVYDVTNLVQDGKNAVGAMLGSGWYRGYIGFENQNNFYGKDIALLFQLEINYLDGSKETVVSDESWRSFLSEVRASEIYHGETVDHMVKHDGWATPQYEDSQWAGVKILDKNADQKLIATYNEPIKKQEIFTAKKTLTTPKGEWVVDFGQNLVGWVQVKVRGKAGDTLRIYHAEVLDKFGNFYTENLRPAKQLNTFVLRGGGEEVFEPRFTFQGFRYIKIVAKEEYRNTTQFTAVALYSDMAKAGAFSTSNPLINQLQHNIQWGQNGNFLDVPTDCPQRDERLGWTGDAQAFANTAVFNRNAHNFFTKWLKDVALDQNTEGSIPFVVPNVLGNDKRFAGGSAGWADVATIIPWNLYVAYGDKRMLTEQYESMKNWVGYMEKKSKEDLWNTGNHFGDWLFYRPFDDNSGRAAVTDKYLIAQCFYAHSTDLCLKAAQILGKTQDVARFEDLLKRIKAAYLKEYLTPNGRLVSGTQTAYVLALQFDMLPENQREQAVKRLVENIKSYDNHLSTGFLGTPYLCHVLSRFGQNEMAYKLLLQEKYPSWLYPVKMGATTIWERWDGIKPDSTFQTPTMNSFNHYAYGAIGDWMYRTITGIQSDEKQVGYKHFYLRPQLGGDFKNASATLPTYYGSISSEWKLDNGTFNWNIEIPTNTTATVVLPTPSIEAVSEGGKALSGAKLENGNVVVKLGSGKYQFTVKK